jgi:hypothetical protein
VGHAAVSTAVASAERADDVGPDRVLRGPRRAQGAREGARDLLQAAVEHHPVPRRRLVDPADEDVPDPPGHPARRRVPGPGHPWRPQRRALGDRVHQGRRGRPRRGAGEPEGHQRGPVVRVDAVPPPAGEQPGPSAADGHERGRARVGGGQRRAADDHGARVVLPRLVAHGPGGRYDRAVEADAGRSRDVRGRGARGGGEGGVRDHHRLRGRRVGRARPARAQGGEHQPRRGRFATGTSRAPSATTYIAPDPGASTTDRERQSGSGTRNAYTATAATASTPSTTPVRAARRCDRTCSCSGTASPRTRADSSRRSPKRYASAWSRVAGARVGAASGRTPGR